MTVMIIFGLAILGLCLGSFVNALVWRLHMQDGRHKGKKHEILPPEGELSIARGRSMCPHCRHTLVAKDLVPVLSWLWLRGKCRYCSQPIPRQYPLVELTTALLFVVSYLFWPFTWDVVGIVNFAGWLILLTGFMALFVYDLRWMLLPNRLVYPLLCLALALGLVNALSGHISWLFLGLSVAIAGGIFGALFIISDGRWIGGGDVKLGLLIGLLLGDPYLAFLTLMGSSLLGTAFVVPGMLAGRVKATSRIPFGPFLIIAAIVVQLFGRSLVDWYKRSIGLL